MRNCEYYSTSRKNKGVVSEEGLRYVVEQTELDRREEYLKGLGVPDEMISDVLQNPGRFPILHTAIDMVEKNPQLTLKEVVTNLRRTRQKPKDYETTIGYSEGLLQNGIRTWEDFIPPLSEEKMKPILFSELPEGDSRKVNCQVFGMHRDRISSSSHYHEHAISYERSL